MDSSYRTQIPVMEESLIANKLDVLTNSKINLLTLNKITFLNSLK